MTETFTLQNVSIFAVGQWNGDVYNESDLDAMVSAYGQVGFKPPLKLGHDESQPFAKSDGMPALGWVANLRRAGKTLYADFINLPKQIYELIKRKAYNRVSAEVYWEYEDGGRRLPRVLKAVALLGAEIPAVTSLAALEALYDASGKPFKRYDFGVGMTETAAMPMLPYPTVGAAMAVTKKDKAAVAYRPADEGGYDRCGACRFFGGPPDAQGDDDYIGSCCLVEGEVATTFVCDLLEVRDAFTTSAVRKKARKYQDAPVVAEGAVEVRPEGGQFCVYKGEQKLECLPTQEEADQLVATMSETGNGAGGEPEAGAGGIDIASALETAGQALLDAGAALDSLKGVAGIGGKKEEPAGDQNAAADKGDTGAAGKKPPFGGKGAPPFGDKGGAANAGKGKPFAAVLDAKTYVIRKRGEEWCLMTRDGSKTLGCHPSEAAAMAQERAVQANKAMTRTEEGGKIVYRYGREAVREWCSSCADSMERANIRELKITYDPAAKTYAGFSQGLCDKFSPGAGFRTRCMDSSLGSNADNPGALCNSLETWCFDNGFLASKTALDKAAKIHSDARTKDPAMASDLTIEQDGDTYCVMRGGEKVVCKPSMEMAQAEMDAMMKKEATMSAEHEAKIAELEAKVAELTMAAEDQSTKVKEYETQIATSEAERAQAADSQRQTENTAWLDRMGQADQLRMVPAEREFVAYLLDALTAPGTQVKAYVRTYKKDGGEGVKEEIPAASALKKLFESRTPNTMFFKELTAGTSTRDAGKPPVPESVAEAKAQAVTLAKEYQRKLKADGKDVDIRTALKYVYETDPDLKSAAAGIRPEGVAMAYGEQSRMARFYGQSAVRPSEG